MSWIHPTRRRPHPSYNESAWIRTTYKGKGVSSIIARLVFCTTLYHVWWERNQRSFANSSRTLEMILANIHLEVSTKAQSVKSDADDRLSHGYIQNKWNVECRVIPTEQKMCRWPKPELGFISLSCDGSVSSTRSGYSGIARDHMGTAIFAYAGTTTSNHVLWVELMALYRGLILLNEQGRQHIDICMDSKLAVEILQSNYKCPWRVLALVGNIKRCLQCFNSFRIQHVWREANQAADILASHASGDNEIILDPANFPATLQNVIRTDANQCIYTHVYNLFS